MSSPAVPDDFIQIGKITGAHGIHGSVKVHSYAESPERFAVQGKIVLIDPTGKTRHGVIIWAQAHKHIVRLTLEGIETRNEAESLVGWGVFIPKKDLPPLEPDTYYWNDLIGMTVLTEEGECLGQVTQIIPTGANDVYVVKTPPDHPAGEILIPAISSVVLDIDIEQGCMRVVLPEGLI